MRPINRRWPLSTLIILSAAIMLLGGLATAGTLAAFGFIDLPFLRAPATMSTEGLVEVPVTVRDIPMYAKVTREDLVDPKTGRLKTIPMHPDRLKPTTLVNLDDILGQVLKRNKTAIQALDADDFYPKGTRPGMAAGIPPGKRALALDANKLQGMVHELRAGDFVDLVSCMAIEVPKGLGSFGAASVDSEKKTAVRVVARNALVVAAVPPPKKTKSSEKLRQDHELVVAVEPEELVLMEAALAGKATLTCVAHSGLPDAAQYDRAIPNLEPPAPKVTAIETIRGSKRAWVLFPQKEPQ